jgi:hypothetical protein
MLSKDPEKRLEASELLKEFGQVGFFLKNNMMILKNGLLVI